MITRAKNYFLILIAAFFIASLISSCSDNVQNPILNLDEENASIYNIEADVLNALHSLENRPSNNSMIRSSERDFRELSNIVPSFAAFKFDEEEHERTGELNIVIMLQETSNMNKASNQIATYLNNNVMGRKNALSTADIKIEKVNFNFRQLQAYRDILRSPILQEDGFTFFDLDDKKNKIVIGVKEKSYLEKFESLISEYPIPREAIEISVINFLKTHSDQNDNLVLKDDKLIMHETVNDKIRPMTGGIVIHEWSSNEPCTLGMVAEWGGTSVFITNSHCTRDKFGFDDKSFFTQEEYGGVIGEELLDRGFYTTLKDGEYVWGRHSDASIIRLDGSAEYGSVAMTNGRSNDWNNVTDWQLQIYDEIPRLRYVEEQESIIGLPVAKVGRTTGGTYGYVENKCVDVNMSSAYSSDFYLFCQDIASYPSKPGDSGAPVFTDYMGDTAEGHAKLIGIHHHLVIPEGETQQYSLYSTLEGIRTDFDDPNLPSGDFNFTIFQTKIIGESSITETGSYFYNSEVENTHGTVSYNWSIKKESDTSWTSLGTGSSQSVSVVNDDDFSLRLEVSDDIMTDTEHFNVTVVTEDCSDPTVPCQN